MILRFPAGCTLVLAGGLLSSALLAGDFRLARREESPPETGTIVFYDLYCDGNKCLIFPPRNWRMEVDFNAHRLMLEQRQAEARVSISFLPDAGGETNKITAEDLRKEIAIRFPQATIVEDFPCFTSGPAGQGVWMVLPAAGGVRVASRLAVFNIPKYRVEMQLTTATNRIHDFKPVLDGLLRSFRVEAYSNGKP